MTKKRFIKLLMGKFRLPRDEARAYADDIVRWREKANFNITIWKKCRKHDARNTTDIFWIFLLLPNKRENLDTLGG